MTEKLSKEIFDWKTVVNNRLVFADAIFINKIIKGVISLESENKKLKEPVKYLEHDREVNNEELYKVCGEVVDLESKLVEVEKLIQQEPVIVDKDTWDSMIDWDWFNEWKIKLEEVLKK